MVERVVVMTSEAGTEVEMWLVDCKSVLRNLVADIRWKDDFFYKFEMETDSEGSRVFCEGHTCLNFQQNAERIGPEVVPLSVVLYIDGTPFCKRVSCRGASQYIVRTPCDMNMPGIYLIYGEEAQ
jgi:hypothetical protein